jgi:tetracycline resistance efflux pump
MAGTIWSLIPPIVAIAMVILTRRVLLSLGVGIIAAALILREFSVIKAGKTIWESIKAIFISEGELNTWNVFILLFLLILGVITAFISISGGSRAFGEWALQRVKTRKGAQIVTALLGIIIFIDDYFNSLAVGQVARPLTDRHRISRTKLAYIIDSTAAPVCVVAPVSSWGAYIIALIGSILTAHGISGFTPMSAFIQMAPMNFYVLSALVMVFVMAVFNINLGSMKIHEQRALETGEVIDTSKGEVPGELSNDLPVSSKGTVGDLIWPIVALVIGTVGSMLWTGYSTTDGKTTLMTIFENTDVAKSLLYGGLFGLMVTLILFFRHVVAKNVSGNAFSKGLIEGIKSMLPAVYILLFAWVIVDLIGQLETGKYLASIVEHSNMDIAYLPVVLFVIAGIMAFSTGTSWGTFGIMLPIAGDIVATTNVDLLLPALAAVLAGAVFGDHCSPISDTTILSSTGAGCHHIDHVMTQLPFAIVSALIAGAGYVALGLTGSTLIGLAVVIILLVLFTVWKKGKVEEKGEQYSL